MAELKDVKRVQVDRGITHIVTSERDHWVFWLCGFLSSGDSEPWPAKPRICRKCRKRLKEATVVNAKFAEARQRKVK